MQTINPLAPPSVASGARYHADWQGLSGAALSLALANLAHHTPAPLILIAHDAALVQRLAAELSFFQEGNQNIHIFPDWETLPYDTFSPHQDIISERLKTLAALPAMSQGFMLTSIHTFLQRVLPKKFIDAHVFQIAIRDQIEMNALRTRFTAAGYRAVSEVLSPGEFAVRGSLFDIYPMGASLPFRIDLFDNEIESIRLFDPETQRTIEQLEKINLLPAREFPLDQEAIALFRQQWRENFIGNPASCPLYETISQGGNSAGIEYYLPLFFQQTATLFDFLPANSILIRVGELYPAAEQFWQEITGRYEQLRHDHTRPLLPPQKLFLQPTEVFTRMKDFARLDITPENTTPPDIKIQHQAADPLAWLKKFCTEQAGNSKILFCAESAGRREALLELFAKYHLAPLPQVVSGWQEFLQAAQNALYITAGPVDQILNFLNTADNNQTIILIPENLLYGQQVLQQRRRHKNKTSDMDAIVRNLAELSPGAPVVHIHHGVGRYLGLEILTIGDNEACEFLKLKYAHDATLYVPVSALHLINRYSGIDPEHAPLHTLGSGQWEKAKRKACEKIRDTAAELLALHAKREARGGFAYDFNADDATYTAFKAAFAFEETPDQEQAILDVISDMQAARSMDRLICGDVGFGKTEVAMRAAFIAVQSGHQVAVLVPTTLLAQQHYQNFCDRFADTAIRIAVLSRFGTSRETTKIIHELAENKVDIIIGTHKLLQPDIQFSRLGLVIIDEEHRFGVQQKERLKKLRAEVDILTLTATPIPRTLNMAMSGMRDLSIIGTPPARRLNIKTFVHQYHPALIREAILREIMRGGQAYYLHNSVATIKIKAEELQKLIPEARISIAHGQMPERELEQVMRAFYHQESNVLLCTTIIETGIDIPTANTIIMDRADKLGLAQLHQLRGRVGRSHHQAYAYLLTPPAASLTADAKKRLDAIASLEDLGAGFALATHDLEIRGCGEILGEEQSGNMQEIGFGLYMELLEKAVKTLKQGGDLNLLQNEGGDKLDIDLQIPALIPADYVPDVHMRLVLYKRIASAVDHQALKDLQIEFIDRFGLLPDALKNLFALTELKLIAEPLGIKKITGSAKNIQLEFTQKPNIEPIKLIKLIQSNPSKYKLLGSQKFIFSADQIEYADRLKNLQGLLDQIKS